MKKIFFLVFLVSNCVFSQTGMRNNYDVKSPNVSDFIRYGNIGSNMYVGELNLSIPLLNVPVNGQNPVDLSLSYNASGFMPNKRSGIVGLNWNIYGIPAITREVKGSPDDHIGAPTTQNGINGRYEHGFMVGIKYLKDVSATLPNGVVNSSNLISFLNNSGDEFYSYRFKGASGSTTNSFETTPDVFSFNVNGISGKFFMSSDGKIKVITDNPNVITVDLTNFNFQPYTVNCTPINLSEIKLIDGSGNKYYFGGESKYLEYTLNLKLSTQTSDNVGSQPVINTWFLKRIEYYNNEIVYYNYQDDNITNSSDFCLASGMFYHGGTLQNPEKLKFIYMNESVNDSRNLKQFAGTSLTTGGIGNYYTLHKKAFLDNISGTNFNIKFNYSSQDYVFNNNSNLFAFYKSFKEFKLDNIVLKYDTQEIEKINFTYSLKGGINVVDSYPRLFLDTVQEVGRPPYSFEYDILNNQQLPKPSTCAIDFWGFYNGKLTNDAPPFGYNQLIPQTSVDANGDLAYTNDIRNADFNFSKIGIIKKVTYPTGGYSVFEYEPHTYSKRLERRFAGGFTPILYDINGIAGGVRIKKIYDFDGSQITNVKEYQYEVSPNVSSGILMQWPRTKISYNTIINMPSGWYNGVYYSGGNTPTDVHIFQSSSINMNTIENAIMNYSKVTEKTTSNGYTVYNFKNYFTNPDNNDYVSTQLTAGTYTPAVLLNNINLLHNDISIERGKLESKYSYSNSNTLVHKEEYFYNIDPNRFTQNSQTALTTYAWWYNSKQYYYNNFLTQTRSTLYNSSGSIESVQNSVYISAPSYNSTTMSNQDVLSEMTTLSSVNNEIIKTEYKYPWQNYLTTSTEFLNFKNANIMYPIREIEYRNGIKLSEKFTLFAKDASTNSLMLPKSIYSAKFPNSLTNITNVGNLEKKFTYDLYDAKGNVLQYTQENGIPVTIIWGYNKSLPIAKIENASLSQVASALGTTTSTLQTTYNESNINALNGLRSSLPNAMITTYIHLPLIGVSAITDPKGDIVTFTYDSSNRLKNSKDKNGNILTEYQYHYKNQ